MDADPETLLRRLRAAGHRGLSVTPASPAGTTRLAAAPTRTRVVSANAPAALMTLPELVQGWLDEGMRLVTGAIAYEAGAVLHGPACARPADTPLAVVHGYPGYWHWAPDTARMTPVGTPPAPGTSPASDDSRWRLEGTFEATVGETAYHDQIRRIKAWLAAGDCYQVNLSQRLTARFRGDPMLGWLRLTNAHAAPAAGYLEWEDGALLSASPERFLAVRDGRVVTDPIKGTRPRGRTHEQDRALGAELAASAKDRAENLMIVDLLRNDLGRVCRPGSIAVPELFGLHKYSNVQHLVSRIRGELRAGVRPLDALLACFPGGSITGAPKKRAMEIIAKLEPVPRGFYCGSLFWQTDDGHFDSNILIRTLQAWSDGSLWCHGGGGVVTDSDPRSEHEESLFKVQALMEALDA